MAQPDEADQRRRAPGGRHGLRGDPVTVLRAGAPATPGMVRTNNQDAVLAEATAFAVADGMGGHAGGEVASAAAIELARASLAHAPTPPRGCSRRCGEANRGGQRGRRGRPGSGRDGHDGRGGRCWSAPRAGDRLLIANVGDCRAYHFHDGRSSRSPRTTRWSASCSRRGPSPRRRPPSHPQRHVITRVLGTSPDVDVDLFELQLGEGDRVAALQRRADQRGHRRGDHPGAAHDRRPHRGRRGPRPAGQRPRRQRQRLGGRHRRAADRDQRRSRRHRHRPAASSSSRRRASRRATSPGWRRRKRLGMRRAVTFRVLRLPAPRWRASSWERWPSCAGTRTTTTTSARRATEIVIYQGRPGRLLWFKPKQVEVTPTSADAGPGHPATGRLQRA